MPVITTVLWDIDGTLLDFKASEDKCIRRCLSKYDVSIDDEQMTWYSSCNDSYWKRLERGEISRDRVYLGRFEDFFEYLGVSHIPTEEFNEAYQEALGSSVEMQENCMEILSYLKSRCKQYAVTNGSAVAQWGKLKRSGIGEMMDGIFISEEIGAEKPGREFFNICAEAIPGYDAKKTIIIGDSLTSDMAGGNNAGILCCWFNPHGHESPNNISIDYVISNLIEVKELIK